MSIAKDVSVKHVTLNLRTEPDEQAVTEEALIDQCIIMAGPEAYQEFLARLDQVPSPNAALRKTIQTPAPWSTEPLHAGLVCSCE